MNKQLANKIYDILVSECGATDSPDNTLGRDHFVESLSVGQCDEYRFQGELGFGGKFYRNHNSWRVDCYQEDDTPKRRKMIQAANEKLDELYELEIFVLEHSEVYRPMITDALAWLREKEPTWDMKSTVDRGQFIDFLVGETCR